MSSDLLDAVVIGAGQAGLAVGYYLKKQKRRFVILEAGSRLGEVWRTRWDSLRLFTPAKYSGLPGLPFPGADFYFPTKDEVADYLEGYAQSFELPVALNTKVDALTRRSGHYLLACGLQRMSARAVVVATGAFQSPHAPSYAAQLDPAIVQLHSSAYQNPTQLPMGGVLVVGAGNSGAEIAIEAKASGRQVWLAGRDTGHIPAEVLGRLFGGRLYWWMISRLLSEDTPFGRKLKAKSLYSGSPLIRLKPMDIHSAGVERVPRIAGVKEGKPFLEDGRILQACAVVWATGFRPDYSWISLPVMDEHGHPLHDRGVAQNAQGLFFLGLHFQHALTSALLGGVGADASYVAGRIQAWLETADMTVQAPEISPL